MGGEITLPGGFWHDGTRHREVRLRPLTGADEAFMIEKCEQLPPAERTTVLLARCVEAIGSINEISMDAVRSLTVGDREALLLQLHRSTFGDALQCQLSCPKNVCNEQLELTLSTTELLLPAYSDWQERYQALVQNEGETYDVRFRLLTGADQEAVATFALDNPEGASSMLLRRCIEEVRKTNSTCSSLPSEEWPAAVKTNIAERLEKLDPQAELTIQMTCPACGANFSALLDAGGWIYDETARRSRQLYREVHWIAYHYHWSERDILSLTPQKRGTYLRLIAETFDRESSS